MGIVAVPGVTVSGTAGTGYSTRITREMKRVKKHYLLICAPTARNTTNHGGPESGGWRAQQVAVVARVCYNCERQNI